MRDHPAGGISGVHDVMKDCKGQSRGSSQRGGFSNTVVTELPCQAEVQADGRIYVKVRGPQEGKHLAHVTEVGSHCASMNGFVAGEGV